MWQLTKTFAVIFMFVSAGAVTAQTHFTFTANTGSNATVAIPASANPAIQGAALASGDEIGVFTPAGLCVGAVVWQAGQSAALTVWGDDEQTSAVDGMRPGEQMHFRVWQQSTNIEFSTVTVTYSQGNGIFAVNGIYILASLTVAAPARGLIVTNTNDSGPGSLREALAAAENNAGPDTITFNIPTTEAGFNATTGVWTITPASGYDIPAGTLVDGAITNGPNAPRPGIEIDGTTLAQQGVTGLRVLNDATLCGLIVNHFQFGIWVDRPNVTVERCYVGTDPAGTAAKPNGVDGILLANGATNSTIQENLLSGNGGSGIRVFGAATTGNTILYNFIGTDRTGTASLPNGGDGLKLHAGTHDNVIENNLISGNGMSGIQFLESGTNGNVVQNNLIGTDSSGTAALSNGTSGVAFLNGPQNNRVGPGNLVAANTLDGVLVDGADNATSTVGNTITANFITANGGRGINNVRGGNRMMPPPNVLTVTNEKISGTAGAGEVVELFADTEDEGEVFLGATTADGSGNFVLMLATPLPERPHITATATDAAGNTSMFSAPITPTAVDQENETILPREFELSQNYPNPFNPVTTISFQVPVSAFITLKIYDLLGKEVVTLVRSKKAPGRHLAKFDASGLSGGIYFYRLEAEARGPAPLRKFVQTRKLVLEK